MATSTISYIGEYQLGNLISNQVPFLLIWVTETDETFDHPLLSGAESHGLMGLLDFVEAKASDKQYPVVLVCQNGELSFSAAQTLVIAGYFNVFVVKEGANGIS